MKATFGVELDPVKCQKAVPFVVHTEALLAKQNIFLRKTSLPKVICSSIEAVSAAHISLSQSQLFCGATIISKVHQGLAGLTCSLPYEREDHKRLEQHRGFSGGNDLVPAKA